MDVFLIGFASLANGSVHSSRVTMHKSDDTSKEGKLKKNIQQVLMNKRINADAIDDLWLILSGKELNNRGLTIQPTIRFVVLKPENTRITRNYEGRDYK